MPRNPSSPPSLRFRILLGDGRAIGPGKIELLEAIAATGSISAAGRDMGMSYKRAWQLVDDLNQTFTVPIVQTSKGGGRGGGATLTPAGVRVLAAYRAIERKAQKLAGAELKSLKELIE
jgi:molybdate transport system regulatory protein